MLQLLTDFNEIRDGEATGLVEDLAGEPRLPRLGELILLHDEESSVQGRVTSIANCVVHAEIIWNTWDPFGKARSNLWIRFLVGQPDGFYTASSVVVPGTAIPPEPELLPA